LEGIEYRLQRLVEEGQAFTYKNFAAKSRNGYPESMSPEWVSWMGRVSLLINATFGTESQMSRTLETGLQMRLIGWGEGQFNNAHAHILGSLAMAKDALAQGFPIKAQVNQSSLPATNRIFIVHGRDMALKTDLEVFLKGLGLEPVVLHRQPDQGATLLEKFERHADVGYAFVLLTPDDMAFLRDELELPDAKRRLEGRARQNVVFEFGFFVGKLGRPRVCCLYKGNVVLPSDLNGLVYKKVDESIESIGYSLIRELKAAGYSLTI
jgi:predicted nucleotide-binding protein